MLWKTHLFAGMGAAFILASRTGITGIGAVAIPVVVAGASSLLPDIDDPGSFVGCRLPIIPYFVKGALGHRGPVHSLLGMASFACIFWVLHLRFPSVFAMRLLPFFCAGFLSHLLLDTLNPPGVPWLWPIPVHFSAPLVEVRSIAERYMLMPIVFAMFCISVIYWRI